MCRFCASEFTFSTKDALSNAPSYTSVNNSVFFTIFSAITGFAFALSVIFIIPNIICIIISMLCAIIICGKHLKNCVMQNCAV